MECVLKLAEGDVVGALIRVTPADPIESLGLAPD